MATVDRAPASLSKAEWALLGVNSASETLVGERPELGQKSPSGLSVIEWAQMGLKSAAEKVREE